MIKKYKVIGVMSGTSIDGADLAYMETDGENYVKNITGKTYYYNKKYRNNFKKFIKLFKKNPLISLTKIDFIVSIKMLKIIKKFIKENEIKKIDYIGFSGQTILHKPDKKISVQLGSPHFLAKNLKKRIVSNFREKDILNGGQGAPIATFYNKYLSKKLNNNNLFVNIGGVSNICFCKEKKLIAFDTGPGNSLIDDFLTFKINKSFDYNGNMAFKGKTNKKIIKEFLNDNYFKKKYPKSLDREHFHIFLNKVGRLNIFDAINTLTMMTVHSIIKGIDLLNIKVNNIILTGGGRKNLFIIKNLELILKKKVINIDSLNFDGDLIEAQAFAYIAIRSIKNLPLSIKSTTGVKKPISGGNIFEY